jgi:hypothetical protein
MRHLFFPPHQVALLTSGVGFTPCICPLVHLPRSAKAGRSSFVAAPGGAVTLTVVAETTEKKDLAAHRPSAGDQAK